MCGIFGVYGLNDKALMKKMGQVLKHRGPDEFGVFTDSKISLGNTRLSIVDLEHGHQPMHNENNDVWVTANCEIYNYKELKVLLEKKGHKFYTNCDTEVIVHCYEEFKEDCTKYLHGEFAFAVWDGKKLFIARDHFGVNPLYYMYDDKNKRFIFASEIKAILEYKKVKEIDEEALHYFFTFMYVPKEKTLFKEIYKLLPGEQIIVSENGIKKNKYYSIDVIDGHLSEREAVPRVRNLLIEAVKGRMMSDVPLGILLSGGVDSTAITAIMSKLNNNNHPIRSYSVTFDAIDDENTRYAARKFGTDHHEVPLEPKHISLLPKIVYHSDFLVADPTCVPTFLISKLARKDVKVVLGGEGADDQLAGYSWLKRILDPENNIMHRRPEKRYFRYVSLLRDDFSNEEKVKLLKTKKHYDSYAYLREYFDSKKDFFSQVCTILLNNYLPHDLLMKVNNMCMANSVEGRIPYLDLNLAKTFNTMIPSRLKIKDGTVKWILRESVKGLVPNKNRLMPKKPFSVPIETVFRTDLRELTFNTLNNAGLFNNLINKDFVEEVFRKHKEKNAYSRQIWALLTFGLWYDIFINENKNIIM